MTNSIIIPIIIAVIGSNGLWVFITSIYNKRSKKTKDMEELKESVDKLTAEIGSLQSLLEKSNNLAKANARDRLNYLSHKYTNFGYIPVEDFASYKLLGKAYEENDGNTIVAEEFERCINELPRK